MVLQDILRFLYSLRHLLRRYPHSCACVSFAPQLCTDRWTQPGWTQKIGWLTDATISMSGFGGAIIFVCMIDNVLTGRQRIRHLQHFFLPTMAWYRFINYPRRIASSPRATNIQLFVDYRRQQQQTLALEKTILHSSVHENGSSLRQCILIWKGVSQNGGPRPRRRRLVQTKFHWFTHMSVTRETQPNSPASQ